MFEPAVPAQQETITTAIKKEKVDTDIRMFWGSRKLQMRPGEVIELGSPSPVKRHRAHMDPTGLAIQDHFDAVDAGMSAGSRIPKISRAPIRIRIRSIYFEFCFL